MVTGRGAFGLCALVGLLPAQAGAPFFVELAPMPQRAFVQQAVPVVVRLGFDPAFVRDAAVPLFAQPLDQPFQLVAPWLTTEPGRVVAVVPPPVGTRTQRLAVGDRVLPLAIGPEVERDGRHFQILELHTTVRCAAPGRVELPAASVRYAFATKFVEDFLRGRQAVDRQEGTVLAAAPTWDVAPLPGPTPDGFTGAIGAFTVEAMLATRPTVVGEAFTVDVVVRSDGDLAALPPLPAPSLRGFHVQGVTERREPDRTVFALDVLPLRAGEVVLPPIAFVAFAPDRASYVTHTTMALPVHVAAATAPLPERIARLVAADAATRTDAADRQFRAWWLVVVLVPLLAGSRRRRQAKRAHGALQQAVAQGPVATALAFEALLALHAGTPEFMAATWERLAKRCAADGVASLRALHGRLEDARFGGTPVAWSELEAGLVQAKLR